MKITFRIALFSAFIFACTLSAMGQQGVVLNGVDQSARAFAPNASPWTSVDSWRAEMRIRGLRLNHTSNQRVVTFPKGPISLDGMTINFLQFPDTEPRASLNIAGYTDFLLRVQFDRANSRLTMEIWKADGSGYQKNTAGYSQAPALQNWSGEPLAVGETGWGSSFAQEKVDFLRVLSGVVALEGPPPPNVYNPSLTYLARYEFEGNTSDSGPNGLHLTAIGNPGYEATTNILPAVNVGADRIVTVGDPVTLTGIVTDSDGTISSYSWTQIAGPNTATFNAPASSSTSVAGLVTGNYLFRLTATDNNGGSAFDEVAVEVVPAPVAVTGGPYTTIHGLPVVVDGSASTYYTDTLPTGEPTVAWNFGEGHIAHIIKATNLFPNEFDTGSTKTISLTVRNKAGASATSSTTVTVTHLARAVDDGTHVIRVNSGGDLATALTNAATAVATGNVEIWLERGAVFTGNYVLPTRSGTNWITLMTSGEAPRATIGNTRASNRVTPAQAVSFAKIVTPNNESAIKTQVNSGQSSYYRFVGLEMYTTSDTGFDILRLGNPFDDVNSTSGAQNTIALVPTHFIVERCVIHGKASGGTLRGIAVNSYQTGIYDSYIYDFMSVGEESQAVQGHNGLGEYAIYNNCLEAATENVMFGGSDPHIKFNATPSATTSTSATLTNVGNLSVGDAISFVRGGVRNHLSATIVRSINGNNITFDALPSPPDTTANSALWGLTIRDVVVRRNNFFKPLIWKNPFLTPEPTALNAAASTGGSLVPSQAYTYRVAAVGNYAGSSTTPALTSHAAGVVTSNPAKYRTAATAPVNITPGGTNNRIVLTWTAPANPNFTITEYVVYRTNPDGSTYSFFTGTTSTTYTDNGTQSPHEINVNRGGTRFSVKNIFELKNAQRVVVAGNILENNWSQGQDGEAVLFTVRNQENTSPWAIVKDVQFSHNIIRHVAAGFSVLGFDGLQPTQSPISQNMLLSHNVFSDVDAVTYDGYGRLLKIIDEAKNITVAHNTFISTADAKGFVVTDDDPKANIKIVNNIAFKGAVGIIGDSVAEGNQAINAYFSDGIIKGNVLSLEGAQPSSDTVAEAQVLYPTGNSFVPLMADVMFGTPDYQLSPFSPFRHRATDGTDPGVDTYAVQAALHNYIYEYGSQDGAIIEAENFNGGGEGVAYHDLVAGNYGNEYRPTDVDIRSRSTASNGYELFFAQAGEWVKYTFNLPNTGTYNVGASVATPVTGGTFHIEVDGSNVTGTLTAPATGSWSTFQLVGQTGVNLTAGSHTLRLVMETNGIYEVVADFDTISILPNSTALPSPWATQDIGNVGVAGSATHQSGTFTVQGSGADIWDNDDQFRYVYRALNGDGEIVARVASLQNTSPYAKAGVMIRESLTTTSRHALMEVSPGGGLEFLYRSNTGGATTYGGGSSGVAPKWVKLVRAGNSFTGYLSSDGVTWTTVGTGSINMGSAVYVGLAVGSHDNSASCQATFNNVNVID